MKKISRFVTSPFILATIAFLAGSAITYTYLDWASFSEQLDPTTPAIRETGAYKYTAPLLLCATYDRTNFNEDSSLRSQVQSIIDQKKAAGEASDVSVYYRTFGGGWFGIDENEQFDPASLLKVPIMIAYYRTVENNPAILNKVLVYDGSFDNNARETFKSDNDIKPGAYTVDNLIKAMIVNSDNNAMSLLADNMDPSTLAQVYSDLGLGVPADTGVPAISPKQYSYFFRILYNSTYLSPQYSEKALELLAGPDFPQGIQATVPSSVAVANKFGERSVFTPQGQLIDRELHDCGIVYAPHNPYIICIMTRGQNFQQLVDVIQSISKVVYQSVS